MKTLSIIINLIITIGMIVLGMHLVYRAWCIYNMSDLRWYWELCKMQYNVGEYGEIVGTLRRFLGLMM